MFNYDHPGQNNDQHPFGYSWKGLARAASGVFIFMAGIFLYLAYISDRGWMARLVLVLIAAYLVAMVFYINRSKKHLMRGIIFNGILFASFWVWVTYFGPRQY
jgi:uncharacterized membrane protein